MKEIKRIIQTWIGITLLTILLMVGAYYLRNSIMSSTVEYRNTEAGFALTIPEDMNVLEVAKDKTNGVTGGEIYFSYEKIDEERPQGLFVVYESPYLEGKGGSCVDEEGNPAYKEETVAGQNVSVCRVGGFKAEYFKNPNKSVEYWIGTIGVENPALIYELETLVKNGLRFE